ncbi:MAG: glycoside hydrolase family 3 N-terminal domain-containing protein [Steroidobacteraceae bacterium]
MTLAEKLGQLTMTAAGYAVTGPVIAGDSTAAIRAGTIGNLLNLFGADRVHELQRIAVEESRLGIPLLFALDVIHGHRTLFPIPLAEAALFDPAAWALSASEAAAEAAADGIAMTFAPMLDVSRDPRWGRSAEGPGEDPWLGAQVAQAKVRGFQGPELAAAQALAAVAKHYCAYGPVTAGRDYASVDISERSVREVHLPPFAAAVRAGAAAVMPAFTDLAGIPLTAHRELLQDVLRGELGFDGVIVSDYNAIAELIRHGVAADLPQAAALALNAGVDIDMMANAYRAGLPVSLERGLVQPAQIDRAVHRVLTLKQRLGLFDHPYQRGAVREAPATLAARRQLARTVAAQSLVLLRNERSVLPLADSPRCLAVIGPLADAAAEMRGPWAMTPDDGTQVTVLAGLRSALPATEVLHVAGVEIDGADRSGIAAAVRAVAQAEIIVLCLGEAAGMSGEAASRAHLDLPGQQRALAQAVIDAARERRTPVVAILFSGRPLVVPWLAEQADAVLAAWFPGSEAGHAIADVLSGRVSPCGRTPMAWPRAVGQIPVYFAQRPGGRPADSNNHFTSRYLDVPNEPLFAFGHGLSYGRFRLSNLQVSPRQLNERERLEVRVDVLNEGSRTARETVFLFTHDVLASVSRPLLELKGFAAIELQPGERGTVTLSVPATELRFLGLDLRPVFEAGEIEILVGPSADRRHLLAQTIELIDAG